MENVVKEVFVSKQTLHCLIPASLTVPGMFGAFFFLILLLDLLWVNRQPHLKEKIHGNQTFVEGNGSQIFLVPK